jgi:hypothetical protein
MAGRVCTICVHPQRQAIDVQLATGCRQATVAAAFGASVDAIDRHARLHLTAATVPTEAPALAPGGTVDVVGSILGLQERLTALLRRAEAKRDLRTCLLALREARVMLETTARLTGQIAPDGALAGEHRFGQATGTDAARSRILAKLHAISRAPAA